MFLARPLPSNAEFVGTGGAFITAWVAHADGAIAERIAREAITEQAWRVESVAQRAAVSRDANAGDAEQLKHFDQALLDGYCLVFHRWPRSGENSGDDTPSG